MEPFTRLQAIAAPLMLPNIDTDSLIPGTEIMQQGQSANRFGAGLFAVWRYDDPTALDRKENPDFVLNQDPYRRAQILLADANFGCGSSREHAVWAVKQWGLRSIIAPSFGNIFHANCFKNGILPVQLAIDSVRRLADVVRASSGKTLVTVDLETCMVSAQGFGAEGFQVPEYYRQMLMGGIDPVEAIASHFSDAIDNFQARDRADRPWIYNLPDAQNGQSAA